MPYPHPCLAHTTLEGLHPGNIKLTKTFLGGYPPEEVLDEGSTHTVMQVERHRAMS
jgi:hypothetical protein